VSEYVVEFNFKNFLVAFIFNLMFLEIGYLGSLVQLIILNKYTVVNMAFWHTTPVKRSFSFQVIVWLTLLSINLLSLLNLFSSWLPNTNVELKNIYGEQTIMLN